MSETNTVDRTRCPLCGQSNRCAAEARRLTGEPQPPCWCLDATFSPELIDSVPLELQGQACICQACAAKGA